MPANWFCFQSVPGSFVSTALLVEVGINVILMLGCDYTRLVVTVVRAPFAAGGYTLGSNRKSFDSGS